MKSEPGEIDKNVLSTSICPLSSFFFLYTGNQCAVSSTDVDDDYIHNVKLFFPPNPLSSKLAPEKTPKHRELEEGGEILSEERGPLPAGEEGKIGY